MIFDEPLGESYPAWGKDLCLISPGLFKVWGNDLTPSEAFIKAPERMSISLSSVKLPCWIIWGVWEELDKKGLIHIHSMLQLCSHYIYMRNGNGWYTHSTYTKQRLDGIICTRHIHKKRELSRYLDLFFLAMISHTPVNWNLWIIHPFELTLWMVSSRRALWKLNWWGYNIFGRPSEVLIGSFLRIWYIIYQRITSDIGVK